jgi:hypothetical protein
VFQPVDGSAGGLTLQSSSDADSVGGALEVNLVPAMPKS